MDPYLGWVAVLAATATLGYLSLVISALRSYSLARLEERLDQDRPRVEQVRALLADEDRLLLGLTALHGMLFVVATLSIARLVWAPFTSPDGPLWSAPTASLKACGIAVGLLVALGDVVPTALGDRRAEGVLLSFLPVSRLANQLIAPFAWLLGGLSAVALRVANVAEEDPQEELKDDILSAALASKSEGVIDEATVDVIENLMEFRDVAVAEVMTPRIDIVSVEADMDLDAMVEVVLKHEVSRLPVIEGSLDRISGILMVKDLLQAWRDPSIEPASLFRRPLFVPETKRVSDLLKELRTRKIHMAIVADEYGGTAGLVTIEDLIEEIIGEINDEHDKEEVPLRRISEKELDVDAKLHIDELNEQFNTKIPEDEDVETLGGFIALRLGRIPTKGDAVDCGEHRFTVLEADERRVRRILVRQL